MPHKISVAHLGARLHYGVATMLYEEGLLEKLYTDIHISTKERWYQLLRKWAAQSDIPKLQQLMQRSSAIPAHYVKSYPLIGFEYWRALQKLNNTSVFLKYNKKFGNRVAREIANQKPGWIYGFTGSSLEIFRKATENGWGTLLEQMSAPIKTSQRIITNEHENWPGWQENRGTLWDVNKWQPREKQEWELSTQIIAPSHYIEDQLVNSGICPKSIEKIPYAVSLDDYPVRLRTFDRSRPLRVLYSGSIRLLKGSPYLLNATRPFDKNQVEWTMVGNNELAEEKIRPFTDKVNFTGQIPRSEVADWYRWADVLVMPSLCEGSSAVTYEAKVSGLPVIATFNSGAWINHEEDGLTIPIRSSDAIIQAVNYFLERPGRVAEMSKAAIERRKQFGWQAYRKRLAAMIAKLPDL